MVDPLIGTLIGDRYRLTDVAGRGGMGIVYRAEDSRLSNRPCAVKLLLGTSMDPEEDRRFERELDIIARLRSRHVVQVIDAGGMPDGRRYIVMELLEGHTLSTVLREGGAMTVPEALPLCRGILGGLAAAHEAGVIHRDLKPANIFVSETRAGDRVAKILDFGIAKETHQNAEELTGRSVLIGTPKYMAPEQFRKQPADERTDLYAAGLVFYAMLAGRAPFSSTTDVPGDIAAMPPEFRVGWQHINKAPEPIEEAGILWPIIARLLAKKPDERFDSAEAVLAAIGEASRPPTRRAPVPMITGELSQAEAEPSSVTDMPVFGETMPLKAHRSRRPLLGLALTAGVGVFGAGVGWWVLKSNDTVVAPDAGVAATEMCQHRIESDPPGASVIVGETNRGPTPHTLIKTCREAVTVRLQKQGYIPATRVVAMGVADPVRVQLDARAVPLAAALDPTAAGPAEVDEPTNPPVEAPDVERAPEVQPPRAPTPKAQPSRTPKAQTPKAQTPRAQTPRAQAPKRPKRPTPKARPDIEDAPPPAAAPPPGARPTPTPPPAATPPPSKEKGDGEAESPLFF